MKMNEAIQDLADCGIKLVCEDGKLGIDAAYGIGEEQLEFLKRHKQALMEAIQQPPATVSFAPDASGKYRQVAGPMLPEPTGRPLSEASYTARIRKICEAEGIDPDVVLRGLEGETTAIYGHELRDICLLFAGRLSIH